MFNCLGLVGLLWREVPGQGVGVPTPLPVAAICTLGLVPHMLLCPWPSPVPTSSLALSLERALPALRQQG